ncbi:chemotaxis protein CheA [Sporolactobacillus shoreicorticis]|uniref:Chemotaxis protein CheA n=1 Tax=Sporolactobacillus shoreicorticis TaxID=1923877 RepID=A0ABW5S8R8_9BACL|nr:chemotaxis protein CheA [Sporolactobacillus shoreicorticis]MCO7125976.1 chemotaxis protein CheA [Sporolactobacillus shoreicorticis]
MDMSQYLGVFLDEAREHLQNLNDKLMTLEQNADDPELINSIFRSAHTLKGSSGQMGFQNMMELTHIMENVFDALRHQNISVNSEMIDVLFEGMDHLEAMADSIEQTGSDTCDVAATVRKLQAITSGDQTSSDQAEKKTKPKNANASIHGETIKLTDYEKDVISQVQAQEMHVFETVISLNKDCVLKAARALMISNAVEEIGTIIGTRPSTEEIEKEAFDQQLVFLIATDAEEQQVLEKINGVSEIAKATVTPITTVGEKQPVEQGPQAQEIGSKKQKKQMPIPNKSASGHQPVAVAKTIRVNLDRIDQLLNLFEELIIDRGRLEKISSEIDNTDLKGTVSTIKRVSNQLQETILNLRMEPIEQVFNRFPRMVRSLSKELNKKVNFVIKGAETELDRTVIEELGDPLMHMIRNSMDHGIETPEVRKEKGKDPQGTLSLSAFYSGNHVFVEIEDDGAGINREKVLSKAIEKNVVTEEAAKKLTDKDVYHLLFASGFSTADKISDISGRGVGLDVVESKIHSLSGTVEVDSAPGRGSKFTVKLPLTLSIINALLVQCCNEVYAVPISSIAETALTRNIEMLTIHDRNVMQYHEQIVPLVNLKDYLSIHSEIKDGSQEDENGNSSVVMVHHDGKHVALIADKLLGYQDIVVKPLGKYLKKVPGFSGATILGDGKVALIIDCQVMITKQKKQYLKEQA